MSNTEQLHEFRKSLVENLARLVYRSASTDKAKLAEISLVKTSIDAVDFILQNNIPMPPPV